MRAKSGVTNASTRAWGVGRFNLVALGAALAWLGYVLVTTLLG
jgi:hypothetical protein